MDEIVMVDRPDLGVIGIKLDGHRRTINPGGYVNGVWTETDISGESAEVQAVANDLWISDVKLAWKAAVDAALPPPPSTDPSDYPLTDRQLRLGLVLGGISLSTIEAAIADIDDPVEKAVAEIWWDRSSIIHWDHAMTQQLMALVGITTEQATAMWMQAKDLAA